MFNYMKSLHQKVFEPANEEPCIWYNSTIFLCRRKLDSVPNWKMWNKLELPLPCQNVQFCTNYTKWKMPENIRFCPGAIFLGQKICVIIIVCMVYFKWGFFLGGGMDNIYPGLFYYDQSAKGYVDTSILLCVTMHVDLYRPPNTCQDTKIHV